MRFKRLLALLLAAALALAVLVGCGSGQQSAAQALLKLLDGKYPNISIEIDPDLEADLRQAISQAEAENAGDDDAVIRAALEKLVGSTVTFRYLGEGQQGDTAFDLVFYAGTDIDKASQAAYSQWNIVFANVPDDGKYGTGLAMVETENGIWMLVKATVEKAGTVDKPDTDDDEPDEPEEPEDPGYTDDGEGNYTVTTAEGLKAVADIANNNNLDINITLDKDITLTREWTPIGTDFNNSYTGTFDGGNHTISGLTVTGSAQYAGLFGYIGSSGKVEDVTLKDVKIEIDNELCNAGGVAGRSYGTLENCSVSGNVSGSGKNSSVGGVVGYQSGGFLTGCSSSATVNAGGVAGGVAGLTDSGATLTACYATGEVTLESSSTGTYYAGGVVGDNINRSTVIACYAWGSVTGSGSGTIYVGGVTGTNEESTLQACYHANGTVSGGTYNGGVAGRNYKFFNDPVITACYWGSNSQAQGIGENQAGTTGGTTMVDGTDVTWQTAYQTMNAALKDAGSKWRYNGTTGTLIKQ